MVNQANFLFGYKIITTYYCVGYNHREIIVYQQIWMLVFWLLWNFFLHRFAMHSSSRHKKHCQMLQTLFWVFQYSRNTAFLRLSNNGVRKLVIDCSSNSFSWVKPPKNCKIKLIKFICEYEICFIPLFYRTTDDNVFVG